MAALDSPLDNEMQEMETKLEETSSTPSTPSQPGAVPNSPFANIPPGLMPAQVGTKQARTFGFPSQKGLIGQTAGTYEAVKKVRIMQLVASLVAGLAVLLVIIAIFIRATHPIPFEGRGWTGLAAIVSIVAFAASLVGINALMPKAQTAKALPQAISAYCRCCLLAVSANAAGLVVIAIAALAGGLANGLWIPLLSLTVLNAAGSYLGWPKIGTLRALHYSPSLPYVH